MARFDRILLATAAGHALLAVLALALLLVPAPTITGAHPALKPMKFALSIALFLATMAVLVPKLALGARARHALVAVLIATMVVEMIPIVFQALRGTTSHFNTARRLDAALWRAMLIAILVLTVAMVAVAIVATVRPLAGSREASLAWRGALWIFQLATVSGFLMGGRSQHGVGGADGGPGLPLVGWSTHHGDLRIAHFAALHGLQVLPLVALAIAALPIAAAVRGALVLAAITAYAGVVVATLVQALQGRSLV
ncbi:MAG: hypothetical protein JNK64_16150 [Myxococcales bacterium]|nr:hypothetical protein [Myxococcales bacterium]